MLYEPHFTAATLTYHNMKSPALNALKAYMCSLHLFKVGEFHYIVKKKKESVLY